MAPRKNKMEKKNSEANPQANKVVGLITETVDIAEEFKKFKSENNNNVPIVVISPDKTLYPHVVSTHEKQIIELGGVVLFFEESPLIEYNMTNMLKYYRSTKRHYFNFLRTGNIEKKLKQYENLIFFEQRHLFGSESEMTISEFANKVNAFVVLAPQKHQMMPLCSFRYWKISRGPEKICFASEYKMEATQLKLELSAEKMLLFQAICRKGYKSFNSSSLLNYIQSLPNEFTFEVMLQISDYTKISFEDLVLLFKYSKIPLSFSLFEEDEEVLGNSHQMSSNILNGFPIPLIAVQIETRIFNYEAILLPIVRKQAGMLLKKRNCNNVNNNIEPETFEIFTFDEKTSELLLKTVTPAYPKNIEVPPLNHLFLRKDYPELDPIRWELATWCISKRLNPEDLTSQEFLIPYLCVWYLVENEFLIKFEGDAIFLAIISYQSEMAKQYQNWNKSFISRRAIQISLLFVNLCNEIKKLFCSIGLNDFANVSPFGGVVFLNIYSEMKKLSLHRRRIFCKMFNFSPTCFDVKKDVKFNQAKKSKKGKRSKPFTIPKTVPCLRLHSQVSVPLLNDFTILKKPAKSTTYTTKLSEQKERKFKVKSLPWTQGFAREYNEHDPQCQEMW